MKHAIKGHPERGNEVIEILEMLGGINYFNFDGTETHRYYYIDSNDSKIYFCLSLNPQNCIGYTLEEFLEKFPYKVGDKVLFGNIDNIVWEIESMQWIDNKIKYIIRDNNKSRLCDIKAEDLKPLKEETMEESINDINKKDMEEIDIIKPTTEINLNHPCFDEHNEIELIIPNGWKFEQRGNKMFGIRKQYPKSYKECCDTLYRNSRHDECYEACLQGHPMQTFARLLICRDAYWKIAGEELGLGKDWKQDYDDRCFIIANNNGNIYTYEYHGNDNVILAFPTEEIRDAFFENFNDLIEQCKELL